MESPLTPPSSALLDQRNFVRLPFVIVFLTSIVFAIGFIVPDYLPTVRFLELLFPEASFFNVQPPLEVESLVIGFVSVVWCVIYFIVASISKRIWLSIALSSSIVGALRIALIIATNGSSPAPDFYVGILNCVIGILTGGFASLAVARYYYRRATA